MFAILSEILNVLLLLFSNVTYFSSDSLNAAILKPFTFLTKESFTCILCFVCLVGIYLSRATVRGDKGVGAVCRQSICYLIMCDEQNNQYTQASSWSLLRIVVTESTAEIHNSLCGSTQSSSQNEPSKLSAIRFLHRRTSAFHSCSIAHAMSLSKVAGNNTILPKPHQRNKSSKSPPFSKRFRQTRVPHFKISHSSNKSNPFSEPSTGRNNGRPLPRSLPQSRLLTSTSP